MKDFEQLLTKPEFYLVLLSWSLIWKGLALWKSAGKKHIVWFVIILLFNTLGLLEIAYLYFLNRWDLGSNKVLLWFKKESKKINSK